MSLSAGQSLAIEQLRDVEGAANGLFMVSRLKAPEEAGGYLGASVTLSCSGMERAPGGLPVQDREQVGLLISPHFPFEVPHAFVRHERFAGFPHVQWKRHLCLYQAPATEWNPSDGMFGFLDRLHLWLMQGALGQLDPVGAALHPPVTYHADGPTRTVVPRVDVPRVTHGGWFGTAHLRVLSDVRVDLVGWSPFLAGDTPTGVAAAVLLPEAFPYEFPTNVADLIAAMADRGVPRDTFFAALQWAVVHNDPNAPLYVVIGTPMRGVCGGQLRQHLTAWYLEPMIAWALKAAFDKHSTDEQTRASGDNIESLLLDWAKVASVAWCDVREDRPEIVTRRDRGAPLAWFSNRTVGVWGCGALGGHVAEYLVRAGAKRLILRDDGVVTPGILVRQPFDDADIGRRKVDALRDRLLRIRPELEVQTYGERISAISSWEFGASTRPDVIIDATASGAVFSSLERCRWQSKESPVPLISMVIGHDAGRGMVALSLPRHSGGPLDVVRQLKLEACKEPQLGRFLEEFWPVERRSFFQPEPGCSDATYIGSAADVAALSAQMLNLAAADLSRTGESFGATGHFLVQPHASDGRESPSANFSWTPDIVGADTHAAYEVRISPSAWAEIRSWIVRSARMAGPEIETGGLLFGERDDAAGVIWVSEASGPPPDSEASAGGFVCGCEGTAKLDAEARAWTRGSVAYLGMWHTHPDALPLPSATDWTSMGRLMANAGGGSRQLMLIIGRPDTAAPLLGVYVLRSADFSSPFGSIALRPCVVQVASWD